MSKTSPMQRSLKNLRSRGFIVAKETAAIRRIIDGHVSEEEREAKWRELVRKLVRQTNQAEVLGEYEAQEINCSLRKKMRAELEAVVAEARAAIAEGKS